MRIAFDGTTLTAGRTGVGYYSEHLLQHLAREVESTGDELIEPGAPSLTACVTTLGFLDRSLQQCGGVDVEVNLLSCRALGDEQSLFDISWLP